MFVGAGVIVVVLLGIWGWKTFKERQDAMAAREFGQAMTLYHAGKYSEALASLAEVQTHRWSRYANLAHLYEANSHLAMNDVVKATSAAQRFIIGTKQNSLMRELGLLTLAVVEERKSQCKEAIKHYAAAQKIKGAFTSRAFLGEARCAVEIGDLRAAIAAYRQLLKDPSESALATYVTVQIADLESKLAEQAEQK